jgi:hypothetical protein
MKKHFRMSLSLPIAITIVGVVAAFLEAVTHSNPMYVFFVIGGAFLVVAFLLWATSEIRFEGNNIIRRILFVYDRTYPITAIKKVRFSTDEDNFGGRNAYASIEFNNGRTFILLGFSITDLKEIVQRIRPTNPAAIDSSIEQHIGSTHKRKFKDNFRSGDGVIFIGGIVVVLIAIAWWLSQRL